VTPEEVPDMAISPALRQAFDDQIALEFSAAYAYLAMAAYFDHANFTGFAHWMKVQHEEEIEHAHKFFEFVLDRGERPHLEAIAEPPQGFSSVEEAVAAALAHEQKVSAAIGRLYELASKEKDFSSLPLLQWFLNEQIEEEATVGRILERVRLAAGEPAALLVLDGELAARKGD
jgi:ferritin